MNSSARKRVCTHINLSVRFFLSFFSMKLKCIKTSHMNHRSASGVMRINKWPNERKKNNIIASILFDGVSNKVVCGTIWRCLYLLCASEALKATLMSYNWIGARAIAMRTIRHNASKSIVSVSMKEEDEKQKKKKNGVQWNHNALIVNSSIFFGMAYSYSTCIYTSSLFFVWSPVCCTALAKSDMVEKSLNFFQYVRQFVSIYWTIFLALDIGLSISLVQFFSPSSSSLLL